MNQTKFEDKCSMCNRVVTRLKQAATTHKEPEVTMKLTATGWRFVTSCCGVAPLAVPVVKET